MATTADALSLRNKRRRRQKEEDIFVAGQWQLMYMKFRKHKLAVIGSIIVLLLYFVTLFHGFLSPYGAIERSKLIHFKPQKIRFKDSDGLTWPYV